MSGLPACAADQENTVVKAAGMRVGDIGVGALHPHGKVVIHEQIENAIYAVGRNALPASLRHEVRSEEHTSELQSLMRISYAVFCLKKKKHQTIHSQQITSDILYYRPTQHDTYYIT